MSNAWRGVVVGLAALGSATAMSAQANAHDTVWTGLYLGVHGGGAWLRGDSNFEPLLNGAVNPVAWNRAPESFRQSGSSALGGVHLGYNWQAGSNLLFGVEVDASALRARGSETVATRTSAGVPFNPVSPAFMDTEVNSLFSARGRLGFVANNLLFYGTGGFAAGRVGHHSHLQSVPPGTNWDANVSGTKTGFVVGGGAEIKLSHSLLLRAEYLYYNLNGTTSTADGVPNNFPGFQIRYNWDHSEIHVARVGLSYQFPARHAPEPMK